MKNAIAFLASVCAMGSCFAATITVTSTADDYPTAPEGSLRAALAAAQDGDTITFDASLARATIHTVDSNTKRADTSLVVDKAVTIVGPEGGIIIDGGAIKNSKDIGSRIFLVPAGVQGEVVFRNLELTHGHARNWNSLDGAYINGGAVCAYSPVWIDQCNIHDCYSRLQPSTGSVISWGPVLYTETAVRITDTILENNGHVDGSYAYGGALLVNGGSLTMKNVIARRNTSVSWGGGLLFATANSPLHFEDCQIEECSANNDAGAIRIVTKSDGNGAEVDRVFKRCAFRQCFTTSGHGGAILCDDNAKGRCIFDGCEFNDCNAGWGGAVRLNSPYGMFINCTFRECCGNEWGPTLDLRSGAAIVNCTFVGNFGTKNANDTSAAIFIGGGAAEVLNSVGAFNYYKAMNDPSVNDDIHPYGGSSRNFYNSIMNAAVWGAKNAKTGDFDCFGTKIFSGDMESIDTIRIRNVPQTLARSCSIPTWAPDPDGLYATKVIGIEEGGLLDGTGWPVKVNADYTWIQYSADDGATWTDLYKASGADGSSLKLITADQRGVPYAGGKTPIGAATVAGESSKPGLMFYVF